MPTPTVMTPDVERAILSRLMDGDSLRKICSAPDMPHRTTVTDYLADPANGEFQVAYVRAKQIGIEARFEAMTDMVKAEKDVQRARLLWDNERWQLSKLAPKVYGDRVAHEHSGPDGGPIDLDVGAAAARMAAILEAAARRKADDAPPADSEG